jgi:chorismate dehydratase
LAEVRTVGLTRQSATSVALLKTLFKLRFRQDVAYDDIAGSSAEALRKHDAILLIGDQGLEALYYPEKDTVCHDLGALWQDWTGLPMVYAVWAIREEFARSHGAELLAVEQELLDGLDHARRHKDDVVESALGLYRFDRESLSRYFALLRYEFGEEYQRGLRRFYELAYEAGELDEVPEFRFVDDVVSPAAVPESSHHGAGP